MLDNHLVELGTQGNLFCFVGCLKRRKEQSFSNSPRVRYKPSSHPCGEKKLATTLCTWSPNEEHGLLPSRPFSSVVAGELVEGYHGCNIVKFEAQSCLHGTDYFLAPSPTSSSTCVITQDWGGYTTMSFFFSFRFLKHFTLPCF